MLDERIFMEIMSMPISKERTREMQKACAANGEVDE
jgi:hypothetical protein